MATRALSLPVARSPIRLRRPRVPAGFVDRVLLPVVGFAVLVSAFAVPLVASPSDEAPAVARTVARPLPVPAVRHLAPLPGLIDARRPLSATPVGGMVFVRCTNLWTALPDGSGERRLLSFPGLASPTFSPDARTIAFLADGEEGQEIWMAAADGSATMRLGAIRSGGAPAAATATGLTWSPAGDRLAFALTGPFDPPFGSSIWTLDLLSGSFERVGTGWPVPSWVGNQLVVAKTGPELGAHFAALWGRNWVGKRLSSDAEEIAAAVSPGWWSYLWQKDTAIVRRDEGGEVRLALRNRTGAAHDHLVTTPPDGYHIATTAAPAVLQGGPVAVTLIGPDGGSDVGLVDAETGTWTVMDYAWDPVWSPAPPAVGRLEAQRAASLVRELLFAMNRRPEDAALILGRPVPPTLAPFHRMGYTLDEPMRMAGGWSVPVTVFGRTENAFGYRDLVFVTRTEAGRVVADPIPASGIGRIRTIDQAVDFLDSILTAQVLPPAGLPAGTRLAPDAVSAWSDGGFGCVEPGPIQLSTGTPALATDYGQVAWPAGPNASSAPFGIYADMPTEQILPIAAAMDAERLAAAGS
ncbi:MAG: PD40 domain-containing protein [Actinobacteria bacterium]|nr:PD40 domain-containing protein [Actinomycetota bacterium]